MVYFCVFTSKKCLFSKDFAGKFFEINLHHGYQPITRSSVLWFASRADGCRESSRGFSGFRARQIVRETQKIGKYVRPAEFWKPHHWVVKSNGNFRLVQGNLGWWNKHIGIWPDTVTVDGRKPANQLRLVVCPITYKVSCIPGGAGFLPSTVCHGIFTYIYHKYQHECRKYTAHWSYGYKIIQTDGDTLSLHYSLPYFPYPPTYIHAYIHYITLHYITLHYMTWHDMTWHDMTWHDMTWHDMTWLHTYIPTYLHTYIPTYLPTYLPTYIHTYIRTYVRTYVHT